MTYVVRNTWSGYYKFLAKDGVDVATLLKMSNDQWGIFSLSEKKLTDMTFATPARAKTFYANNLAGKA